MAIGNGDILRVAARQLLSGTDEIVNVFHFDVLDIGTNGDEGVMDAIALKLSTSWVNLIGGLANNLQPNIIDVYNTTHDVPLGQVPWHGSYTGGSSSGNMLPSGVALLVMFSTGVKRVQGRTYLGGMVQSVMDDGLWLSGYIPNVSDWVDDMRSEAASPDATELKMVIFRRSAGTPVAITGRRISNIPAYQRRRRIGRGS